MEDRLHWDISVAMRGGDKPLRSVSPTFAQDRLGGGQGRSRKGTRDSDGRHTERALNCFSASLRPLRVIGAASRRSMFLARLARIRSGRREARYLTLPRCPTEHTLVLSVNASNQSFTIAKREQLIKQAYARSRRASRANESSRKTPAGVFLLLSFRLTFGRPRLRPRRS